jgi:hypothetical protein
LEGNDNTLISGTLSTFVWMEIWKISIRRISVMAGIETKQPPNKSEALQVLSIVYGGNNKI